MPWEARAIVSLRKDFVLKALAKEGTFAELCRRYGISRKTGYKWVKRFEATGVAGLDDVLRDFWFAAVADDMRMLRAFKPERGAALLTWLTFHVAHIASEHIRRKGEEATFVPIDEARHVAAPVQASVDEAIRAVVRDAITREMRQTVKATSQSTLVTSAEYVSADRAAEIAGVRSATVRQWVSGGKLPGHRAGRLLRIRTDDLHRFLSGGRDTTTVVDIETRRRRALDRLR